MEENIHPDISFSHGNWEDNINPGILETINSNNSHENQPTDDMNISVDILPNENQQPTTNGNYNNNNNLYNYISTGDLLSLTQNLLKNPITGFIPHSQNEELMDDVTNNNNNFQNDKKQKRKMNWNPANLICWINNKGELILDHYTWHCTGKRKEKIYWKCARKGCPVRKTREEDRDPEVTGRHNHLPDHRFKRIPIPNEESLESEYQKTLQVFERTEENPHDIMQFEIYTDLDKGEAVKQDGYQWLRYGYAPIAIKEKTQKKNKPPTTTRARPEDPNSRTYWKCLDPNCSAKKQIEFDIQEKENSSSILKDNSSFSIQNISNNPQIISNNNQPKSTTQTFLSLQEQYAQVGQIYGDDQIESFDIHESTSDPQISFNHYQYSNSHSISQETSSLHDLIIGSNNNNNVNQNNNLELDNPISNNGDDQTDKKKKRFLITYFGLHNHGISPKEQK